MVSLQTKLELPYIAIVGRTNVGKSTLFNRLIGRRRSITDKSPGVTRDPVEELCTIHDQTAVATDTGGYKAVGDELDEIIGEKCLETVEFADVVLLVMDVVHITGEDHLFVEKLRQFAQKLILVVNKVDTINREPLVWNYHVFGFQHVVGVSASHGRNFEQLKKMIAQLMMNDGKKYRPSIASTCRLGGEETIRLAILGKPNTGKSTLTNLLIGEEKSIVSEKPGTTRDVIESLFTHSDVEFQVLDTAGIRRKQKITDAVEYYSVNRAVQTIQVSDVVLLVIDAVQELSEQDKKIASLVVRKGRGIIIVLNKWDLLSRVSGRFPAMKERIRFFFPVLNFAPVVATSAATGYGVDKLCNTAVLVKRQLERRIDTSVLNRQLQIWLERYPLPGDRHIKIRYATQIDTNPVKFIFFVNRRNAFPQSYTNYLKNRIRTELGFQNIPIEIEIRES